LSVIFQVYPCYYFEKGETEELGTFSNPSLVSNSSSFNYRFQTLKPLALIYQEKMDVKGKTETKVFPFDIPLINVEC